MENMGDRIKRLRTEHGWTQDELGKLVGLQRAAINKYEKGSTENMKRSVIEKMSKIFGVTPSYLLAIEDNEKTTKIDEVLDNLVAFDGKPINDHDREVLKGLMESYLKNRE